jgi:hypothetical protein
MNRPAIDHLGISEIVAGLIVKKYIDPNQVDLSRLHPPYDEIVRKLRENTPISQLGGLYAGALSTASRAAEGALDVLEPMDWLDALTQASIRSEGAVIFRKASKDMEEGKDVDHLAIMSMLNRIDDGTLTLMPLSQVDDEIGTWFPTHWAPVDEHVGGLPDSCLTIIAGPPGVGKTSVLIKMALAYTKAEKSKRVLIYSLEMTAAQLKMRLLQIGKASKDQLNRIFVSQAMLTIDEIYAEVNKEVAKGDVAFVGVDFADLAIKGMTEAAGMEHVYRASAQMAKQAGVPVVLLAQLNDNYRQGPPMVNDIRWSRLAEAVARLILLVYNPRQIWAEQGQGTTKWPIAMTGKAHLIVGKSSFGTQHEGIGAIEVDWKGINAWGDKGVWSPQPSNASRKTKQEYSR